MVNLIWFLLLLAGFAAAAWQGNIGLVTQAAFAGANKSVSLIISLAGVLMLWLGVLALLEQSGLLAKLGRFFAPLLHRLFPELPADSPAFSGIVLNFCANLLGLGNAATPFGLQAMQELQRLNPRPDTASNSMITLLLLNTSAVTLLPTTVIALRSSAGSANPAEIVVLCILSSAFGLAVGLLAHTLCRRLGRGR